MKHLSIIFSFFFLSCNQDDSEVQKVLHEDLSTSVEYNQIDGVEPNLLSLDVYHSSNLETKKPVVIWVHGGAWSVGDKANKIDDKVSLFRSLNYVLVSVNYRLSSFPYEPDNQNRTMYPTHNNDIADAIRWVYDNIDQYGGDPDKIALLGHSAGAQLVALTGTNGKFLVNVGLSLSAIKGVATVDTEGYNVLSKVQDGNDLYVNAFGTNTDVNIDASPVYNVKQGLSYPKFFVAKRGSAKRIAIANDFIDSLEANGVSVSQVEGSIYNHEEMNDAIGQPGETLITDALKDFLANCF